MPQDVRPGRSVAAQTDGASCPLCLVAMREKFRGVEAEETGARFGVAECPRCGLGRTRPLPDDLTPYYGASYYGGRHGLTARFCTRRRLRIVGRLAGPGAGRSLLDFGCGDGGFLLEARERGWDCRGVERDRPRAVAGDLAVVASLDDFGEGPQFDCATFWHVLEHLDDPVDMLDGLRGRMKPGGVVVAAVPNFGSWQSRATGASWLHLDLPRHLSHFTEESLARTFEAAGFQVAEVFQGELEYDVIGWSQSLLNRAFGGRNEFFKAVSGRPGRKPSALLDGLHVVAGLGLATLWALPAWLESRIGRGGTLIACARAGEGRAGVDA